MFPDWQNKGLQSHIIRFSALLMAYVFIMPMVKLLQITGNYQRFNRYFFQRADKIRKQLNFGDYQANEHDIVVCCYPKSGTNWMMQITYQIAHHGNGEFEHIHDVIPWPDGLPNIIPLDDPKPLENSPTKLRVIKTHLNWNDVPYNPDARYICVLRDPKDVFVSSYFFVKDVAMGLIMPSPKAWLESYLSDYFALDSWAEHLASYWENRHKDNVLILTFAEMKIDLAAVVQKVADFMGVELSAEAFERVIEQSGFDYMKNIDHKFYPGAVTPFAYGTGRMMRKGKRGTSGEILSQKDQKRIDAYMKTQLQELGSDFPYDEMFDLPISR
jgi:Sulfotransferase domain